MPSPMSTSVADGEHEISSLLHPPYLGEPAQHSDGGNFSHQEIVPVLASETRSSPRASTEMSLRLGASPCPVPGSNEMIAEVTERGETVQDNSSPPALSDNHATGHSEFVDKTEVHDDLGAEASAEAQPKDVRHSAERFNELQSLPQDHGVTDNNSDPSEAQLPLPLFKFPLNEANNASGTQYSSPNSSYADLGLVTNAGSTGLSSFFPPSDSDWRRHSSANLSPTAASSVDLLVPVHFPEQKRYSLIDSGPLPSATPSLDARRRTKSELGLSAGTPPLRRPRGARGLNGDGTESGSSSISESRQSTARYSTFAEMGIESFAMTKGEKTIGTKGRGKRKAEKTKRREVIVGNGDVEETERKEKTNETEQPKATEQTAKPEHAKTLSKVKSRDCVIM